MKKTGKVLFVVMLALSVVALNFGPAFAMNDFNDPVVTPLTSGSPGVSTLLSPTLLPGAFIGVDGMYFPVGFVEGQAQFGGSGVNMSELVDGATVKICFDFPLYSYQWWGNVRMWDGVKWVVLPTTIYPAVEESSPMACVTGVGNGTYALVMGYYGPPAPRSTPSINQEPEFDK